MYLFSLLTRRSLGGKHCNRKRIVITLAAHVVLLSGVLWGCVLNYRRLRGFKCCLAYVQIKQYQYQCAWKQN